MAKPRFFRTKHKGFHFLIVDFGEGAVAVKPIELSLREFESIEPINFEELHSHTQDFVERAFSWIARDKRESDLYALVDHEAVKRADTYEKDLIEAQKPEIEKWMDAITEVISGIIPKKLFAKS